MIGRWTAGSTRGCGRSGRRRAGQLRGGFTRRMCSRRSAAEPQRKPALQGLFRACLGALVSPLLATLLALPPGSLPRLVPASIADGIAQREHAIDIVPLPAHARSFEPCFHHHLVRTFHAARANGPTGLLIGGVLHVRLADLPNRPVSPGLLHWDSARPTSSGA